MKRLFTLAAFAAFVTFVFPAFASAQATHDMNSRKADLRLSSPLVVGDVTVKPGEYKVQCKKIDGVDYLVVTSAEDGREAARVPCRPEQLTGKAEMSEIRSVTRDDGAKVLTAVRIKGETIGHRVAVN